MLKNNIDHVVFDDSYLLGWSIRPGEALLFVQILLTPQHPDFRPYDIETEFGCYRLGVLRFGGIIETHGISGNRIPLWSATTHEFDDVDEINAIEFCEATVRLEGDETSIEISASSVRLEVLSSDTADAFSGYFS